MAAMIGPTISSQIEEAREDIGEHGELKYADVEDYKSKWTSDAAAVLFLNSKANLGICRIGGGEQPPS